MKKRYSFKKLFIILLVVLPLFGGLAGVGLYFFLEPRLPSIDSLKDVRLQIPLRVFTKDHKLIAEFGEKKRSPVHIDKVPPLLIKAHLAAEDDRFYEHPGVDYHGLLRAIYVLVSTGRRAQGGSTITMQVARNFFLTSEKTYLRKVNEILLSLKIERELSKNEILELYLNKMFLGKRSYGVGAAAQVYYGKTVYELTVAQMAMIAGLYKAPSAYNPIVNPTRAKIRRNYVLGRMKELGFIDDQTYQNEIVAPISARLHSLSVEVDAPYVAEMVRAEVADKLGDDAYTAGFKVITTVDSDMQIAANAALQKALISYDLRHGYRGPEGHVELAVDSTKEHWGDALKGYWNVGGLGPALVVAVEEQSVIIYLLDGKVAPIYWEGLSWARPHIDENRNGSAPSTAGDILKIGDIIRVKSVNDGVWELAQVPQVEGALVSLDPNNGAINALVGGFDFTRSKFNRVTQAERQPGSNFKPFVYSAALEHGYTPATLINDAPVVFSDSGLEDTWRPENYSGKFFGPTRFRKGLIKSRNLISIRILRAIGVKTAIDYAARFGFNPKKLPRDLSLALGSAAVTPLELVTGYAVFANGGYHVKPFVIQQLVNPDEEIIMQADPITVCTECEDEEFMKEAMERSNMQMSDENDRLTPTSMGSAVINSANIAENAFKIPNKIAKRVITPQNHYLMTTVMQDVVKLGTGRRALVLKRNDLAGKTGTTNDQRDAWFSGFATGIVTTAWVGFNTPQPLGNNETGGRAALPMWINFMREALKKIPEKELVQPPGLVTVRIDPDTGLLAGANTKNAIFETFRVQNVPTKRMDKDPEYVQQDGINENQKNNDIYEQEQLF